MLLAQFVLHKLETRPSMAKTDLDSNLYGPRPAGAGRTFLKTKHDLDINLYCFFAAADPSKATVFNPDPASR
jgi:hypothetical protein